MAERITPIIDFRNELVGLHDLSGRVAYLPGGYGGLGEAIAWGLALNGARVVVSGRSSEKAAALAGDLEGEGFEAAGLALDVTSTAEIRDSVDFVIERFGGLDILVNCVGIQREEPLLEVSEGPSAATGATPSARPRRCSRPMMSAGVAAGGTGRATVCAGSRPAT